MYLLCLIEKQIVPLANQSVPLVNKSVPLSQDDSSHHFAWLVLIHWTHTEWLLACLQIIIVEEVLRWLGQSVPPPSMLAGILPSAHFLSTSKPISSSVASRSLYALLVFLLLLLTAVFFFAGGDRK